MTLINIYRQRNTWREDCSDTIRMLSFEDTSLHSLSAVSKSLEIEQTAQREYKSLVGQRLNTKEQILYQKAYILQHKKKTILSTSPCLLVSRLLVYWSTGMFIQFSIFVQHAYCHTEDSFNELVGSHLLHFLQSFCA